jgi:glycosyltransferase involved in cell wall biosynthesis
LQEYLPAASTKAVRIYNCVEPIPSVALHAPIAGWRGEPFLLAVAQHRRNKNLSLLIRTLDRLRKGGQIASETRLIIVGIHGPETAALAKLVAHLDLDRFVYFVQGISDSELQWCYRHCEALVSPSLGEGFGLPIAEGIIAGCRIVASDISAHREIGDGRCTFVRLNDRPEETLASAILDTLREPKPEPKTLPKLSAPVLANQYVGVYRRLIAAAEVTPSVTRSMTLTASATGNPGDPNPTFPTEMRKGGA